MLEAVKSTAVRLVVGGVALGVQLFVADHVKGALMKGKDFVLGKRDDKKGCDNCPGGCC